MLGLSLKERLLYNFFWNHGKIKRELDLVRQREKRLNT